MKLRSYRLFLLLGLFLVFCAISSLGVICNDFPTAYKNCSMVTPPLNCGNFSYQVFDNNQTLVSQGVLQRYNASTYFFDFSERQGQYVILLCDGTFRQIYVNGDGEVITGSILAILGVIGILLFIYSKLDESQHKVLKTFILLFVIFLTVIIPRALNTFISDAFSFDFLKYYIWFLKFFLVYLFFYFIWSLADYYQKTAGVKRWVSDKLGNKGGK